MFELKARTAQEVVRNEKDCDYMDELFGGVKMPPTQVYLKVEADEVIAELKKACKDKDDWCLHLIKERHHHKYKRCMAMAKYCEYRFMNLEKMIDTEYRTKKMRLSHRWWVKWLKLADKFKETK